MADYGVSATAVTGGRLDGQTMDSPPAAGVVLSLRRMREKNHLTHTGSVESLTGIPRMNGSY